MADLDRVESVLSSRYWRWTFLSQEECPPSLVDALRVRLPHVDPLTWEERLLWGGAYVNGAPAPADITLAAPCKIEYYEPKFDFRAAAKFFPPFKPAYIVYEDDDFIAAYKPAELSCHPSREQAHFNMKRSLEQHCRCTLHMPTRLDMATQGLVIASKNENAHYRLQRAFEERLLSKSYVLEVEGRIQWRSVGVGTRIANDPAHPVLRKVSRAEGKEALTEFHLEKAGQANSLLIARPLTGRTHQIRLHAAHLGHPIVGDNFYGGRLAPELRLVSFSIRLGPPTVERELGIELPERLWPEWLKGWRG